MKCSLPDSDDISKVPCYPMWTLLLFVKETCLVMYSYDFNQSEGYAAAILDKDNKRDE